MIKRILNFKNKSEIEQDTTICDPITNNRLLLLYLFGISSILFKASKESIHKYYPKKESFMKLIYYFLFSISWIYYYLLEPILSKTENNFAVLVDTWDMFQNLSNKKLSKVDLLRFLILGN